MYLVTVSRVLPQTLERAELKDTAALTRQDLREAVLDSFCRDRADKLVVFRELREDGDPHFHVAVRLKSRARFASIKKALRDRHGLPSHFSLTHTEWWSACRYGALPSQKKPIVDLEPDVWTWDGRELDLLAESQEPWNAAGRKRRREQKDKNALSEDARPAKFGKPELTDIVLAAGLTTKASIMEYVQDHGTAQMQAYVQNNQRKLTEILQDA